MSKVETPLKVMITGTACANMLAPYCALVELAEEGVLGQPGERFERIIARPIRKGLSYGATPEEKLGCREAMWALRQKVMNPAIARGHQPALGTEIRRNVQRLFFSCRNGCRRGPQPHSENPRARPRRRCLFLIAVKAPPPSRPAKSRQPRWSR